MKPYFLVIAVGFLTQLTDPIIWVLPEEYFVHCFIIFFVAYEVMMLSLVAIARKQLNHHLKNNERKDEK